MISKLAPPRLQPKQRPRPRARPRPSSEEDDFRSNPIHRVRPEFFENHLQYVLEGGPYALGPALAFFTQKLDVFRNFLMSLVDEVPLKLRLDTVEGIMYPEFGDDEPLAKESPPFFYFLAQHRAAHSSGAVALHLDVYLNDEKLKRIHLNVAEEDPGEGFGVFSENVFVAPSSLTLFLKYAQEYIDPDKHMPMELDGEVEGDQCVLWPRTIPTIGVLVDYLREHQDEQKEIIEAIVFHANAFYRVPLPLAHKIRQAWDKWRTPVTQDKFFVKVLAVPRCATVLSVLATINAYRFLLPLSAAAERGGDSYSGNDDDDCDSERDPHAGGKIEIITTSDGEDAERTSQATADDDGDDNVNDNGNGNG